MFASMIKSEVHMKLYAADVKSRQYFQEKKILTGSGPYKAFNKGKNKACLIDKRKGICISLIHFLLEVLQNV